MSLLHSSGAFDHVGNVGVPRCTIVRVHPLMWLKKPQSFVHWLATITWWVTAA